MTILRLVLQELVVRTWFTLLALACFLPQQFMCCAESCNNCAEPTVAHDRGDNDHGDEVPCEHHGDHEHEVPPTSPDQSHHLCVATHLFYVTNSDLAAPVPDLHSIQAVLSVWNALVDRHLDSPEAVIASLSVPPPAAQRLRAALSVWTI